MVRIHLAFTALPPALNGIADHTARLAEALVAATEPGAVTVLTTPEAAEGAALAPGIRARSVLRWRGGRIDASGLAEAVADERPDVLLLQYNPNSWGRRGLNPSLPGAVRAAQRARPGLRFGLIVHEPFYVASSVKRALLAAAQRPQLRALVRAADVVFVSTEGWMAPLRRWAGAAPVVHFPIGSNIPHAGWTREAAREALGIGADALVAGVFGTAHHTRLLPLIRAAVERLQAEHDDALLLYVGPDGAVMREALAGLPVRDLGALPGAEVSRALAAMDLHLAPYERGVSTRRGAFSAGLQHALPTLSTRGPHTDRLLAEADGTAVLLAAEDDADAYAELAAALAADPARRSAVGAAARRLYLDAFDWPLGAACVLAHCARPGAGRASELAPAALP